MEHYLDLAAEVLDIHLNLRMSERKIAEAMCISKSNVHRLIQLSLLSDEIKSAAKKYKTERYALLEFISIPKGEIKDKVRQSILSGELRTCSDVRHFAQWKV